jgi:hypothetical protein
MGSSSTELYALRSLVSSQLSNPSPWPPPPAVFWRGALRPGFSLWSTLPPHQYSEMTDPGATGITAAPGRIGNPRQIPHRNIG